MCGDRSFAVAILAGGRSSRMGRDKAAIVWEGRTLLERQVELAWSLRPQEVFVVGRTQAELGELNARGLPDAQPGQGPLGGLATVLGAMSCVHVLLLAIDMPALTEGFLAGLLAQRVDGIGVVPRTSRGWEPLAAVFPRTLGAQAAASVAAGRLALQRFVDDAVQSGQIRACHLRPEEVALLANWNAPGDVPA